MGTSQRLLNGMSGKKDLYYLSEFQEEMVQYSLRYTSKLLTAISSIHGPNMEKQIVAHKCTDFR